MRTITAFLTPLLACASLGCASMTSSVEIAAPPAEVWAAVEDLAGYDAWNPFFTRARGALVPGQTLALDMAPVGASPRTFSPTVIAVDPPREIVWRGRLLVPGLFDGTHHLVVDAMPSGGTRFTQRETFRGLLVPFVAFEPYRAGWARMNEALKARVERR